MTLLADRPRTDPIAEEAAGFLFASGVRDVLPDVRVRCTVVRLESIGNERLGVPRWYTLAEAWAEPGSASAASWSRNPEVVAGPGDDPHLVLATGTPVVVLGADIGSEGWSRAVVDAVRASCPRVLVVDLGDDPDPRYADVSTFGLDRERGAALLRLLSEPS
ncbi:hypothetical protein [Leifsonia sp. NPDC080035]|uniref:Uncharacterized protein n=1 Tax=Leifsonia sp. NPDC080035 TaxID=3143936 RepID=A0AAU7GAL3_9MICO